MVHRRKFSAPWVKKSRQRIVLYLSCAQNSPIPASSETERIPYEVFWHCETNFLRPKIMISHLSCISFFDAQKFLEHQWVRLLFISLLWNKKISTKYRYTHLLWIKVFDMSEISQTLKGSRSKILSTVSQQKLTEVRVIPLPCTELSDTRK